MSVKRIDSSHYQLSTGRVIYANRGVVGLDPDDESMVYHGYDGEIHHTESEGDERLSPDELREIAAHMVEAWTIFSAKWRGHAEGQ